MKKIRTNEQIADEAIEKGRISFKDILLLRNRLGKVAGKIHTLRRPYGLTDQEGIEWGNIWDRTEVGKSLIAERDDIQKALGRITDHGGVYLEESKATDEFISLWYRYKTSTGVVLRMGPFGAREIAVLEAADSNAPRITFDGVTDVARYGTSPIYVPVYSLVNEAGSFQYYVSGGRIGIVG